MYRVLTGNFNFSTKNDNTIGKYSFQFMFAKNYNVQVIFFQTIRFCFQFQTLNHMVWFCWQWFFKVIRFIHVQFLKKEKLHDSHDSEITKDSSAGLVLGGKEWSFARACVRAWAQFGHVQLWVEGPPQIFCTGLRARTAAVWSHVSTGVGPHPSHPQGLGFFGV